MSELTQTQARSEGPGLVRPFRLLISRRHDELWGDPSSSSVTSWVYRIKNLLAPLLVSKHSTSPEPRESFCSHLVYLNPLLICTRHLHCHCLIYSLLLCTLSASSSFCLSAQFPFILMPSSSRLIFLVSTSFEFSLYFPFLSPLFLLYIISSVSLILLLTTSANSYHLLWCNTLLQYLSPFPLFNLHFSCRVSSME